MKKLTTILLLAIGLASSAIGTSSMHASHDTSMDVKY